MKFLLAPLLFVLAARGATMTVTPSTIYNCQNGQGTAVVTWSGASGPVQIHVQQPSGTALTGWSDPSGSVTTGNWVSDGLQFFLVNQAGVAEAIATAHVSCGATASTLLQGLQGGSYFPLQVGDAWVYRYNNRSVTGTYVTRTITSTQVVNGLTYYVMMSTVAGSAPTLTGRFRGDQNGVIWMLPNGAANSAEQEFLDPSWTTAPGLAYNPYHNGPTSYTGALGTFTDAVAYTGGGGTEVDLSTYVRGIGLVSLGAISTTGSSGGFVSSLDLVEVRLNGVRLSVPVPSISLGIQTTDLDLASPSLDCTVPCYFVACGLAGEPAGGPCVQVRVETSALAGDMVQLQLLNSAGVAAFTWNTPPGASGSSFNYVGVPLYTSQAGSNQTGSNNVTPLPAGNYQLVGRALASGVTTASALISVRVH